MVGCVGEDAEAATLMEALQAAGVATDAILRVAAPMQTGSAIVLLTPEGQNSIVVTPGANGALTPAHLHRHSSLFAQAGMVLTQLETPTSVLRATLTLAARGMVPVMLDPAPAAALPADLLAQAAWFTPNETEARFYAGTRFQGSLATEVEARGMCELLRALGPKNILLKLGRHGAGVLSATGAWFYCAAPRVQVVDTTGAGDTLNAAFAAALLASEPAGDRMSEPADATVQGALQFAVAAASLSVTRAGGMPATPTAAEVAAFLRHMPRARGGL